MKQEVRRGRKFVEYHDPETQDEFTFTQEISGADVSYQETDGSWHPADENWATDGVDGHILKNDKLNHKIRLKGNGGRTWYPRRNVNTEYMTFGVPQYRNGNKWSNFSFSGWSVDGKTITLNTRQGVTILVHNRWNGIKIDWVLASSSAPSRMRYAVTLTGITYTDGIIYGADGAELGRLTPTTATDSSVDERGMPTQLPCSGSYSGGYVEFQADVTGAVYPVTIDPDFSVQPDPTAGKDTYLYEYYKDRNYGVTTSIALFSVSAEFTRTLIQFDLSSISTGATVSAATLGIYENSNIADSGYKAKIYRGLVEWYEGNANNATLGAGVNGSTWNYRNNNGTVAWSGGAGGGAGSDYEATATDEITLTKLAWNNFDVTADAAYWVANPTSNFGSWIIRSNATKYYLFYSSDYTTDTSLRPKLTVTYTAGSTGTLRRTNMNAQMSNLTGGMHG